MWLDSMTATRYIPRWWCFLRSLNGDARSIGKGYLGLGHAWAVGDELVYARLTSKSCKFLRKNDWAIAVAD